jgi:hypothetical protein
MQLSFFAAQFSSQEYHMQRILFCFLARIGNDIYQHIHVFAI